MSEDYDGNAAASVEDVVARYAGPKSDAAQSGEANAPAGSRRFFQVRCAFSSFRPSGTCSIWLRKLFFLCLLE